jgi:hypothetical protein
LATGSLPQLTPSRAFDNPPEASALPPVPAPDTASMATPSQMPDLPAGTTAVPPPPNRDTTKPTRSDRPTGFDEEGNVIPGNKYRIEDDLSVIRFETGNENFDADAVPNLERLAADLKSNSGIRITLTAYAKTNEHITPREARRLSLTRALAIRDYLTTKGISSARIDVRALGANSPSGDPDRVDIKAN